MFFLRMLVKQTAALVPVLTVLLAAFPLASTYADDVSDLSELVRKAEQGDVQAQVQLGMRHLYGMQRGADYAEAHRWFRSAAEADDPVALYFLGTMHEKGCGVEADTALAHRYYARSVPGLRERAASGDPDAMANLGLLFNLGRGIPRCPDSARYWVERAAETDLTRAQYYNGFYALNGVGGNRDPKRALLLLERAALGGNFYAQTTLGNIYYNGLDDVQADTEHANEWFRRAEAFPAATEEIQDGVYHYRGIPHAGDVVIPGLLPPRSRLAIKEGDCGEACLWTLLRRYGIETTKIDISEFANEPGRGLHMYELHRALDHNGVEYRSTMSKTSLAFIPLLARSSLMPRREEERSDLYRRFLYDDVIASVIAGTPAILAVKNVPDRNTLYPADHFILIVGYNPDTDELIYNSHNRRERIKAANLLGTSDRHTLVNRYDWTGAIYVPLPER